MRIVESENSSRIVFETKKISQTGKRSEYTYSAHPFRLRTSAHIRPADLQSIEAVASSMKSTLFRLKIARAMLLNVSLYTHHDMVLTR